MRIVLDTFSALEYWLSDLAPKKPTYVATQLLTQFDTTTSGEISDGIGQSDGKTGDLLLLVRDSSERRDTRNVTCSAWGAAPLPPNSICEIGNGVYCISPELCVVRLASCVPRLELLRHITDLMGQFARCFSKKTDLVQRDPILTREALATYLDNAKGVPGTGIVRQVLNWVRERSASPREASMLLMLTLPTRLGGMGIPEFEANVKIELTDEAKLLTRKQYLVGDAVFKRNDEDNDGPILEYNSNTHHDTEEQLEFDFEKITALQRMGLTVIPVSTRQFNELASFEQVVQRVRQLTGKREKTPSKRMGTVSMRRSSTHAELLRLEREQREEPSLADTARWLFLRPRLHDWRDEGTR